MTPLGYAKWQNSEKAIKRAMASMDTSEAPVQNHFAKVGKMIELNKGGHRPVTNYELIRYACYLCRDLTKVWSALGLRLWSTEAKKKAGRRF